MKWLKDILKRNFWKVSILRVLRSLALISGCTKPYIPRPFGRNSGLARTNWRYKLCHIICAVRLFRQDPYEHCYATLSGKLGIEPFMTNKSKSKALAVGIAGERAMSRWIWVPMILILLLSGCAATSLMVGVSEPDLTKIQPSDERAHVERMLGERLWRLGLADGLTYDIYQYKASQPTRPGWGAVALGLDVLSLGIMEFNVRDAMKARPVKQVAVAYDEQDRVRFMSQPWGVAVVGPCRRMRSLVPADSGVPSTVRPSPIAHPVGSASEVAILELDRQVHVMVDGREIEGHVVELPPGGHDVDYSAVLGGSHLYGAVLLPYNETFGYVELLPGRRYRVERERFYPGYRQRADVFWIEDVGSGETLKCDWPKPH